MKPVIEAARLLRAESTRFRAVRGWMIALSVAAVMFVLVSFFSAFESRSGDTSVPAGPGGEAVTDTYTFVHQELAGDGTLTTRVTSLAGEYSSPDAPVGAVGTSSDGAQDSQLEEGLAPWAKAGIILEPDTSQGTRYVAVMVTGSHGVQMQYNYTHDTPGLSGAVGPSSPRWLRLTRGGDVITGYASADGVRWSEVSAVRLTGLPRTVQIGLFVTSPAYFTSGTSVQGTPSVATAAFDHISVQGDLPRGYWTGDAIAGSSPSTWQQRSAGAFTISGSGDIAPLVGGEDAATHWSGASVVNGTIVALLFVIVLAALPVTSEYRRGLTRATFVACPRRGRVLAAKAVAVGSLAFAAGAIATAIAEAVTRHVFAANGNYIFPQSGPDTARVITGTGLFLGLAAALAVAVGSVLRRSAGTVAVGIVLLVVPGVLATAMGLPANVDSWLMRLSPDAAFAIQSTLPRSSLVTGAYIPANGYFPISPWAGLTVLAVYTAAALGAAVCLVRRRDALTSGLASTVQAGLFATSPGYTKQTSEQVTSTSGTAAPTDATATFDRVGLDGDWPGSSWTGTSVSVRGTSAYVMGHEVGYRQAGGTPVPGADRGAGGRRAVHDRLVPSGPDPCDARGQPAARLDPGRQVHRLRHCLLRRVRR